MSSERVSLVPRTDGEPRSLRREIRASQRGRMLVAMSDVVGEKGYAAATVADVLAAAGVSRKTFYEHFTDKQACFLAAYEHGVDVLTAAVVAEFSKGDDWREAADLGIGRFLELLGEEPGFARAFLVEVWAAGPEAIAKHGEVLERIHGLMRGVHDWARRTDPRIGTAGEHQFAAVAGGISRVATIEILAGRAADLPALREELVDFAVAVLARRDTAPP